jgi:hypothetical protein
LARERERERENLGLMQLNLKPRAPTESLTSKISENTPIERRSQLVAYLVAEAGETFAEKLIHRFEHEWGQDIDAAVQTLAEETIS